MQNVLTILNEPSAEIYIRKREKLKQPRRDKRNII